MRFGYMLNGLDFGLFKTKAILGEYKNRVQIIDGREFKVSFFKLTPDVYLDWFQEYIYQRGEAFANNSHLVKKQIESEPFNEKTVELFKDLEKKVSEKLGENYAICHISKPIEESKEQKQAKELQKWIENEFALMSDFDTFENGEYSEPYYLNKGHFKGYKNEKDKFIEYPEKIDKKLYVKLRFEEIHKQFFNTHDIREFETVTDHIYNEIEKLINGKV